MTHYRVGGIHILLKVKLDLHKISRSVRKRLRTAVQKRREKLNKVYGDRTVFGERFNFGEPISDDYFSVTMCYGYFGFVASRCTRTEVVLLSGR